MDKYIVLIVDDDETVLESMEMELSGHQTNSNYRVVTASSGKETIEILDELESLGMELALVICDYLMPGMMGDDLLIHLHKTRPAAVKILLTGQSSIKGVTRCINEAGLYRYIAKPWEIRDLKLTINEAIRKFKADRKLLEQSRIISLMNKKIKKLKLLEEENKLKENHEDEEEAKFEEHRADRELYDQIFFSRFFISLPQEQKYWFAKASIGLITASGQITNRKLSFIEVILKGDSSKERIDHYVELLKSKASIQLGVLKTDRLRAFEIMKHLTWLISVNRKIHPSEKIYFGILGQLLGLDESAINEFLKIATLRIDELYIEFKLKNIMAGQSPHYQKTPYVKA